MAGRIEFWMDVRAMRERMQANAPEGQNAQVTIYLHSGESFRPNVVATSHLPWLTFETPDGQDRVKVVSVEESKIAKIEIAFGPKDEKELLGFAVKESAEIGVT